MIDITNSNFKNLKNKFNSINNKKSDIDFGDGKTWFKSHRTGSTGIGKTFEDLLNKKEDNLQQPDFEGIEIKAHDFNGASMITLFTKTPNLPKGAANFLREKYGYTTDSTGIKVLHMTVPSNECTYNKQSHHWFSIIDNKCDQTIDLKVYDKNKRPLEGIHAKWSYKAIESAIDKKLKNLAIVLTNVRKYKNNTYYNYYKIIVTSINKNVIISALNDGNLFVDLRLGAYKSGKNKGKYHDHGTGFRISLNNLSKYVCFKDL